MSKAGIGLRQVQDVTQKETIRQAQNVAVRNTLIEARFADEEEDEQDERVESEPPEPPEVEDAGDSSAHVEDESAGSEFDRAWYGHLPLMRQLPRRLRPPVRYRIDAEFAVRPLYPKTPDRLADDPLYRKKAASEHLEQTVAEAIAEHLRQKDVHLDQPGDWCRIPCIGGDDALVKLIPKQHAQLIDTKRFHSIGNVLKNFAIELPNRDVVTPQALISPPARKGKRTTRGAALRWASQRPSTTPDGTTWSQRDWDEFERNQKKVAARVRRESTP